jgi:DNA-binding NarL/FixJ family response regulator
MNVLVCYLGLPVRQSIKRLLQDHFALKAFGECADSATAFALAAARDWDVIILRIILPNGILSFLDAQDMKKPHPPVIVIAPDLTLFVMHVCLKHGAMGFVLEDAIGMIW